MKKIYIAFSGHRYHKWTQRIVEDHKKYGCDTVQIYDDKWLRDCRPEFMKQHADLFAKKCYKAGTNRGYGWFCWKPFIILDALRRAEKGDIVLYTDADTFPIADLTPLFTQCEKDGGIMLFNCVGWTQRPWGKRDMQIIMDQDTEFWRDQVHACGRFMLFQKGAVVPFKFTKFYSEGGYVSVEQFLTEWLDYTCDIRCNTFDPSTIKPEYPDLREPRCEQAILTNLAHRYGFKLYREACGFGESVPDDRDLYPQLFVQEGSYSTAPGGTEEQGSVWRNVLD